MPSLSNTRQRAKKSAFPICFETFSRQEQQYFSQRLNSQLSQSAILRALLASQMVPLVSRSSIRNEQDLFLDTVLISLLNTGQSNGVGMLDIGTKMRMLQGSRQVK